VPEAWAGRSVGSVAAPPRALVAGSRTPRSQLALEIAQHAPLRLLALAGTGRAPSLAPAYAQVCRRGGLGTALARPGGTLLRARSRGCTRSGRNCRLGQRLCGNL